MKHFIIQKFSSKKTSSLILVFVILLSSCCKDHDCKCPKDDKIDYTEFFIAHAGGAIDGYTYTNCLEALNLSYSKGCRLFELDLTLTTDGKIVAVHDWINFKKITNYSGTIDDTPLTEKEFLSLKIYDKYTPLNMKAINLWFRNHPDAILVTDKINDPKRIYDDFLFHKRVIMELFTWEAVDIAINLGIKPMVSENLIFGSSKKSIEMGIKPLPPPRNSEIEQILKDKRIEYICMSRYYCIIGSEDFLRKLKKNGIKNYVYHLGLPVPISGQTAEKYVWNYEMNFCYGMYADDLDLLTTLLNEQKTKR